ncbi:acetyl-CoA carboxylase biotin carboxyl carrier protein subunit [Hydrocarboniphaga sp.]|uniref:acetyl-CoA carboxylase biotin carboxyl carrier protein subunit n=1 Tax=Hydrocarboniphaga sp. TaxID=2033016 RepID=UPI003D0CECB8
MHHAFKLGEAEHNVELSRAPGRYRLHVGDSTIAVNLADTADGRSWLTIADRHVEVVVATRGDDVYVHYDGEAYQLQYRHPLDRLAASAGGSADDQLRAPMPGSIVAVQVGAGDAVVKGQTLLVMESMKMETLITAPRDGVIDAIAFEKGQTFDRDALLVTLKKADA